MKKYIQRLLRESLMGEVSDAIHSKIKQMHMNDRIVVTKNEGLNFIPVPSSSQPKLHKPKGLWYGIGDSWISYIKRNDMSTWDYDYVYKIEINESKMVIIRNMDDMRRFDAEFGYDNESRIFYDAGRMIDWERVAARYSGIEIAPYLNDGYEYKWYEIWDVASGCIWNKDAIIGIDKLVVDNEIDEGFLSSKIGNGFDAFKKKWDKIKEIAHREGNETYLAATILYNFLNPETKSSVTDGEIKFLKSQSKDILRILTVVGLGAVSMAIPIALEKILNKYGKTIMPGETKIGDSEK